MIFCPFYSHCVYRIYDVNSISPKFYKAFGRIEQNFILDPITYMARYKYDTRKKKTIIVENSDFIEEDEEEDDSERLSVYDAALIWGSRGMDEDDMFGYSEEELLKELEGK